LAKNGYLPKEEKLEKSVLRLICLDSWVYKMSTK